MLLLYFSSGLELRILGYNVDMNYKYTELLVFLTGAKAFSFDTNLKSVIFANKFSVSEGFK